MSADIILRGVELEINQIGTARIYGFGHSGEVVRKALKTAGRHNLLIFTKCGVQWYDGGGELYFAKEGHEIRRDLSLKAIQRDSELSLKTLQTDYIDIYYTHWQRMIYGLVPTEETMNEFLKMKQGGKIQAISTSDTNLQVMRDYVMAEQLDVIRGRPSTLGRKPEAELLPFCKEHGITLQAYSPIEQGLLVGRTSDDYVPQKKEVRGEEIWWKSENVHKANRMLAGWKDLAEKYNCTLINLCIRWDSILSPDINMFCGARKLSQIEGMTKSVDVPLSRRDFLRMEMGAGEIIAGQV